MKVTADEVVFLFAEKLSKEIFMFLDKIAEEVEIQTINGVNLFKSA